MITLSIKPREDYKINTRIVDQHDVGKFRYNFKNRYIAVLDRIFPVTNEYSIWEQLCNNGVFDIWEPSAPHNSLKDKNNLQNMRKNPMILLLRIFEIEHDFTNEIINKSDYVDHVPIAKIKFIRPVIPNNKNDPRSVAFKGTDYFDDIIKKIQNILGETGEEINDTSSIHFGVSQ